MSRVPISPLLATFTVSILLGTTEHLHAQEPASTSFSGQLVEVVVTARRRAESLQETPVAVTAFSGAQLDRLNIQQIDRISQLTPNLAITEQTASTSASTIHIRGIGEQNPILTSESGVGLYLDGVYVARTSGAIFDLVDLERIEVLRGPQGTLFGRNTTGGAIQLVSRTPAREFGLQGKLGYGRFDEWYARAQLDTGMLAGGPLRASLAYLHRERSGHVDNTLTPDGEDPGSINTDAIWATLRGEFGRFVANYTFDYNDRRGSPMFFQLVAATPDVRDYFGRSPLFGGSSFLLSAQRAETVQRTEAAVTPRTESVSRIQGHALTLEHALTENLTAKSITSYREMDVDFIFGLSGNGRLRGVVLDPLTFAASVDEVAPIQGFQNDQQNQFSQELQLLEHGERWDYVLGAFYFREHIDTTSNQFLTFVLPGGQAGINLRPQSIFSGKSESIAAFGQISYRPPILQDRLEVTTGARITRDRKSLNVIAPASVSGSDDFERASWLASLDYGLTDRAMIYGRATTGYKSGGLNPTAGFLNSYGPEKALAFELGLKSEWLDRRLRANLALFHTTYDDLQVQQFVAGTEGSQSLFVNAGEANYQGVELEIVARVMDRLTLEGSLGYTDPEYERFEFRDPISNRLLDVAKEAKFPYLAKTNIHAGIEYRSTPKSLGVLSARLDYSYGSERYFAPVPRVTPFLEQIRAPGQHDLSARITLSEIALGKDAGGLEVSVWGANLTDEDDVNSGIDFGSLGFAGVSYVLPRRFGIDVKMVYR